MTNPHNKFEVNRLKHFQVIAQKPFSDGDTRNLVPIFKRNLSLAMSNPHIKFEVNRSRHARVIAQKPFSMAASGGTRFKMNLPLSMSNPHIKFEVNWSRNSQVIAWKPFSDGSIWWHYLVPFSKGTFLDL